MDLPVRSRIIRELASRAGFQHCGLSPATPLAEEQEHYLSWLDKKQWGKMDYLWRNLDKRLDPTRVMPGARTVIALLTSYKTEDEIPADDNLLVARYAWGKDYHARVRVMLKKLISSLEEVFGGIQCQPFVDSGIIMEKAWAQRCGIGWRGKNTLLINRDHGSWFFIGILLTDLETVADQPENDRCGSCDRCLRACPTGALESPHVLNPLKCISYHTIESQGEIPKEFRDLFSNRIFGCDICQEVCPFNRVPLVNDDPDCKPGHMLTQFRKGDWENLSRDDFDTLFNGTPVVRAGFEVLLRNIRFVTGK
jgi:epoxyqueuosine reductase